MRGGVAAIGTRNLATQTRGREDLSGVAEVPRIEGRTDALHDVEIIGREHPRHVRRLVGADAMLAGDRPSGIDAVRQDLAGHFRRPIRLTGNALVVVDEGMEVAVAGVKDVANPQPRSRLELTDAA